MGMMDTRVTRKESGKSLPPYREPGTPRPAFFAVRLVNEKLRGFETVEKVDLGSGVWAYQFSLPTGKLWVLWYDDGKLYFPGETPPSATVEIPLNAAWALVTRTPSQIGAADPEIQTLDSTDGILRVMLDSTPVFVEAGSSAP